MNTDTDKAIVNPMLERELVFNEVIYGLTVLLGAIEKTQSGNYEGVRLALKYVQSMKDYDV